MVRRQQGASPHRFYVIKISRDDESWTFFLMKEKIDKKIHKNLAISWKNSIFALFKLLSKTEIQDCNRVWYGTTTPRLDLISLDNAKCSLLFFDMGKVPKGYYRQNKDRVMEIAASCKDFAEFRNKYPHIRSVAQKMEWIADIKAILPHKTYWNREMCEQLIKENGYKTKEEFRQGNAGAHGWAYKHGVLDDLFKDMEAPGNYNRKKIYVYEFDDGYAYVGLTDDLDRREYQHKNEKSPVRDHIEQTGIQPERKILSDWLTKDDAKVYEDEMINAYAAAGWKMLNSKKGGSLGRKRDLLYNLDELKAASHTCNYRVEFRRKYPSMYEFILRHDMLEEVLGWMPKFYMPPLYWTDDKIRESIEECGYSKKALAEKYPGAYESLCKDDRIEEFFGNKRKVNTNRTRESAIEECCQYKSLTKLMQENSALYYYIRRHHLEDKCFKDLERMKRHADYTWDDIEATINASRNLTQMRNEHTCEYRAALRNPEWRRELYRRLPSRKHKSNL